MRIVFTVDKIHVAKKIQSHTTQFHLIVEQMKNDNYLPFTGIITTIIIIIKGCVGKPVILKK